MTTETPPVVDLTTVVSRSLDLVASEVDGEVAMLHIETGKYYGLTRTGAVIWRLLEQPVRVDALCDRLMGQYRVTRGQCEEEVLGFLRDMVAEGLVAPVS